MLEHLGNQHGLLGLVFRKAQNKIQNPAQIKRPWRTWNLPILSPLQRSESRPASLSAHPLS